jgi:glucose-1-phosphate adenylyltransferase
MGYVFEGFWEDIGTIRRFYEVNLEMAAVDAPFDFYNPRTPIYTRPRFMPASELFGATMNEVLLTDGCRILDASLNRCVVGLRSIIGSQVQLDSTVMMGADFYETENEKKANYMLNQPDVGIGAGSKISRAIIDKNARIGCNVEIRNIPDRPDEDGGNWVAHDGIIIIPKNAIIPDNTII